MEQSARPAGSSGRRGARLWTWLVGLVLLPILALTTLATVTCVRRAQEASAVAGLEPDVRQVTALARLGFEVADESTTAGAVIAMITFRLTPAEASAIVGFDVTTGWQQAPASTDAALRDLPPAPWLTQAQTQLRLARAGTDSGTPEESALGRYYAVQELVKQAAMDVLVGIEDKGSELAGGDGIRGAAELLRTAYEALVCATAELPEFFNVYAAGSYQHIARQDLARRQEQYGLLLAELRRRGADRLGASWTELTTDPAMAGFDLAVRRVLASRPGVLAPLAEVAAPTFQAGRHRIELLRQMVQQSSVEIAGRLTERLAAARASLRWAVTGTVLIGLLTLLAAWLIARTVARPLHALAERAGQVNDGELDVPPVAERGVREVVAVTSVFNDMVRNLGLLGRQTEALARGDLSDSSLTGNLPGALGRSLQGSVEQLSESLAARDDLEERLRHEATHDGLTGLLNRAAAGVGLQGAIGRAHRTGGQLAVMVIDIDNVKRVNDSRGQHAGDELLVSCAHRFAAVAREGDTLARLDSDKFLLIADVPEVTAAVALAERIRAAACAPVLVGETTLQTTASIGLTVNLDATETGDTMLRDAEAAVRRAKAGGGDRVEVFDAEMRRQLAEQDTIERALARALEGDLLELHYQPVVDTETGALVGFEALCRWTDPELGPVSPVTFIAAAERSDLVIDLDRWVLGVATRQLASWQRTGTTGLHMAVNISGRHLLRGDIVSAVRRALDDSGILATSLIIEITETVLLTDLLRVADTLSELRRLGVRVAIDDFGTGYTSIAHLRQLPVDILKIDRSLVSRVDNGQDAALVALLVQTGHTLGLGLVAEGAEEASQLDHLRDMGCEHVQGYLVSRPMSVSAADEWISRRHDRRTVDADLSIG